MKKIGFLSFGHWTSAQGSQTRSASDALLQSIDLVVAAEPRNDVAEARRVRVEAKLRAARLALHEDRKRTIELRAFKDSDAAKAAGSELMAAGDLAGAEAQYTRALEYWEGNAAAQNNRSLVRLKRGDFGGCRRDASDVLDRDATNVKALYRRGLAQRSLGDLVSALDDFDRLLALAPGDAAAKKARDATRDRLDAKNGVKGRVKTKGVVDDFCNRC